MRFNILAVIMATLALATADMISEPTQHQKKQAMTEKVAKFVAEVGLGISFLPVYVGAKVSRHVSKGGFDFKWSEATWNIKLKSKNHLGHTMSFRIKDRASYRRDFIGVVGSLWKYKARFPAAKFDYFLNRICGLGDAIDMNGWRRHVKESDVQFIYLVFSSQQDMEYFLLNAPGLEATIVTSKMEKLRT